MNPKVIIKTKNIRAVGYRVLRRVKRKELDEDGKAALGVLNIKSYRPDLDKETCLGEYEPVPHTFELISKPWVIKCQESTADLTNLEQQLLNASTVVTILENYWLEEIVCQ